MLTMKDFYARDYLESSDIEPKEKDDTINWLQNKNRLIAPPRIVKLPNLKGNNTIYLGYDK